MPLKALPVRIIALTIALVAMVTAALIQPLSPQTPPAYGQGSYDAEAVNITVSLSDFDAGQTATITAKFENKSSAGAGTFDLRIVVEPPGDHNPVYYEWDNKAFKAADSDSNSETVSQNHTFKFAGDYTIRAEIYDIKGNTSGWNEDNRFHSLSETITTKLVFDCIVKAGSDNGTDPFINESFDFEFNLVGYAGDNPIFGEYRIFKIQDDGSWENKRQAKTTPSAGERMVSGTLTATVSRGLSDSGDHAYECRLRGNQRGRDEDVADWIAGGFTVRTRDTTAPDKPLLSRPGNGARDVTDTTPELEWFPTSDNRGGSGIKGYQVQITGPDRDLSNNPVFKTDEESFQVNVVLDYGTYKWKVKAIDNNDNSTWSDEWSFTIVNPPTIRGLGCEWSGGLYIGTSITCTPTLGGGTPSTYAWSAPSGNPNSGSGSTFTTKMTASGNRTIRLTVQNTDIPNQPAVRAQSVRVSNRAPTLTNPAPDPDDGDVELSLGTGNSVSKTFQVTAGDEDGNLRRVEWYRDDSQLSSEFDYMRSGTAEYTRSFSSTGTYTVRARAYDSEDRTDTETWTVNVTKPVSITIDSSPQGLAVSADGGTAQTTPYTLTWTSGTAHTLAVTSPQTLSGQEYDFTGWEGLGAATSQRVTPDSDTTYTANFQRQSSGTTPDLSCSIEPSGSWPEDVEFNPLPGVSFNFVFEVANYTDAEQVFVKYREKGDLVGIIGTDTENVDVTANGYATTTVPVTLWDPGEFEYECVLKKDVRGILASDPEITDWQTFTFTVGDLLMDCGVIRNKEGSLYFNMYADVYGFPEGKSASVKFSISSDVRRLTTSSFVDEEKATESVDPADPHHNRFQMGGAVLFPGEYEVECILLEGGSRELSRKTSAFTVTEGYEDSRAVIGCNHEASQAGTDNIIVLGETVDLSVNFTRAQTSQFNLGGYLYFYRGGEFLFQKTDDRFTSASGIDIASKDDYVLDTVGRYHLDCLLRMHTLGSPLTQYERDNPTVYEREDAGLSEIGTFMEGGKIIVPFLSSTVIAPASYIIPIIPMQTTTFGLAVQYFLQHPGSLVGTDATSFEVVAAKWASPNATVSPGTSISHEGGEVTVQVRIQEGKNVDTLPPSITISEINETKTAVRCTGASSQTTSIEEVCWQATFQLPANSSLTSPVQYEVTANPPFNVLTRLFGGTTVAGDAPKATITVKAKPDPTQRRIIAGPSALAVSEGSSTTYEVELSAQPTSSVTVRVSGQTGTDLTVSPATLTFTPTNWNRAKEVRVTAGQDDDADADTSVTLLHTPTGGGYTATAAANVTVTINEDDIDEDEKDEEDEEEEEEDEEEDQTEETGPIWLSVMPRLEFGPSGVNRIEVRVTTLNSRDAPEISIDGPELDRTVTATRCPRVLGREEYFRSGSYCWQSSFAVPLNDSGSSREYTITARSDEISGAISVTVSVVSITTPSRWISSATQVTPQADTGGVLEVRALKAGEGNADKSVSFVVSGPELSSTKTGSTCFVSNKPPDWDRTTTCWTTSFDLPVNDSGSTRTYEITAKSVDVEFDLVTEVTVPPTVATTETTTTTTAETVAVATGLSPLGSNLNWVLHFDNATQEWQHYDPDGSPSTGSLTELESGRAYWIGVDSDQTVTLGGVPRSLKAGLNQIVW